MLNHCTRSFILLCSNHLVLLTYITPMPWTLFYIKNFTNLFFWTNFFWSNFFFRVVVHWHRFASNRAEWVMKPIPSWNGSSDLKLIPEWFKARYVCALNSFFPHPHFPTLIILLFKFKVMSIQLIDFRVIDTCFYAPSDNSSRIILARKSQKKKNYSMNRIQPDL